MRSLVALVLTFRACVQGESPNHTCGVFGLLNNTFIPPFNPVRHRRQTTEADQVSCAATSNRFFCDSFFAQNYVDGISMCSDLVEADISCIESLCRKNLRGEYCGEAFVYVTSNCSTTSYCSTNCFHSLQHAGCCLNRDDDFYSEYLAVCKIPEPSACPVSNIRPRTTFPVDSSCDTEEDYFDAKVTAFCKNVSPLLKTLEEQRNCRNNGEFLRTYCSSRNGRYCLKELNLASPYFCGDSLGRRALERAVSMCSIVSDCTFACNSALILIRNTLGCCVDTLSTIYGGVYPDLGRVLNLSLWKTCDISYPEKCDAINVKWSSLAASVAILSLFWYL